MTTNPTIRYFADTIATEQLFRLKYAPNRFSAGASPQNPLEELTALPQTPNYLRSRAPGEGR